MASKRDGATTLRELPFSIRETCVQQGITADTPANKTIRRAQAFWDEAEDAPGAGGAARGDEVEIGDVLTMELLGLPEIQVHAEDGVAQGQEEFQVLGLLGEGGMGMVHLAIQRALERVVALKVIRPDQHSAAAVDSLLREARLCGGLEHPNIVPVHALARDRDRRPQLVMKKVEGTSWHDLLHEPQDPARLGHYADPLDRHLEILMQVCNAIEFAHSRGVVHRDIKPENVMVGEYGEVYVLDWGIAHRVGERDLPEGQFVLGTPAYMAPEMLAADPELITPRTDVYLLGATLHEVLTGSERHEGRDVFSVLGAATESRPFDYSEDVPAELGAIANRACNRDPAGRFPSVQEFRAALAAFLEHRGSVRIAEAARQVLPTLQTLVEERLSRPPMVLAEDGEQDEPMLQAHQLFSECRFGFRQALLTWPDNEQARDGLQTCIELMTRFELAAGNYDSARALVADLLRPVPELERRLEALARDLEAQEDARAELARLRRDQRFQGGDWRRSLAAAFVGLGLAMVVVGISVLDRLGYVTVTHFWNLVFVLGVVVETVVVAWLIRGFLFESKKLLQFWTLVCCVVGACLLNRIVAFFQDVTFQQVVMGDLLIIFLGLAFIAVTMVRTFWWGAGATAFAAVLSAIYPGAIMEVAAGVVLMVHLFGAWAMRPESGGVVGESARRPTRPDGGTSRVPEVE